MMPFKEWLHLCQESVRPPISILTNAEQSLESSPLLHKQYHFTSVSPAMLKAEAADPLLSCIDWNAFNYPWCSGYAP
eukprot:5475668-Ditylum_brightwellii.AAC.1